MKDRPAPRPALLLAGLLALAACRGGPKHEPAWQVTEMAVGSDRLLWEITVFALEKEGFPVGTGLDPTTLVATSGWRYDLSPFRGKGRREQAQASYERVAPGRYRVQVRVKRELNMDIVRPLDLQFAQWEEAPDDPESARVLLQRIRSWVAEVPEFGPDRKKVP